MKPIFVIIRVTYDWYRFQDNIHATTDWEQALEIASDHASKEGCEVITDPKASEDCVDIEKPHIFIETFAPIKRSRKPRTSPTPQAP